MIIVKIEALYLVTEIDLHTVPIILEKNQNRRFFTNFQGK